MFSKRDNFRGFLFAYLEDEYPKMGSTFKGMNVLRWEHFFSFEITPIYKGGNNENAKVASPESVPIHLKELLTAKNLVVLVPDRQSSGRYDPQSYLSVINHPL